jgi:hypothetical protein
MWKVIAISMIAIVLLVTEARAQENRSAGNSLGVGAQATAPFVPPDAFPASGVSFRTWFYDAIGLEFDLFWLGSTPSFSPRFFWKWLNTELVDLYCGVGWSFFVYAEKSKTLLFTPFQGISGIEIRLTPHIALNAEVGLFGHSGQLRGMTSGLGFHFYF